jgi:hypothetical protein
VMATSRSSLGVECAMNLAYVTRANRPEDRESLPSLLFGCTVGCSEGCSSPATQTANCSVLPFLLGGRLACKPGDVQ